MAVALTFPPRLDDRRGVDSPRPIETITTGPGAARALASMQSTRPPTVTASVKILHLGGRRSSQLS
jgi:hypothetical protein